jgi:hypothetical protein
MPVPQLDVASTVSDGLARQHLRDDARSTDVVQTARDTVGLPATGAPNPYLQLLARIPGFEPSGRRMARCSPYLPCTSGSANAGTWIADRSGTSRPVSRRSAEPGWLPRPALGRVRLRAAAPRFPR